MTRKFLVPVVLPADPTAAMEAVTKQYADSLVVIAASDPIAASPAAELWVDTSVAAGVITFPVGYPRGLIGNVVLAANQTGITTVVDVTGMTVTWTADATRIYKTTVTLGMQQLTAGGSLTGSIADAANTQLQGWALTLAANDYGTMTLVHIDSGISGSTTRKARATTNAGTLTVFSSATSRSRIIVEDIGGT